MRRIAGLALVAALLVPVSPAQAGFPSCGGFSPIVPNCTFTGVLSGFQTLVMDVSYGFTGRISVVLATSLGRYSAQCSWLPPYLTDPFCRQATSGTLIPGDSYVLRASTSLAVDGTDTPIDFVQVPGLAVGRWEVRIELG